jgi:hypothetical protein
LERRNEVQLDVMLLNQGGYMTEPSWDMSVLALSHLTKSQDSCLNSSYEVSISLSGNWRRGRSYRGASGMWGLAVRGVHAIAQPLGYTVYFAYLHKPL